MDNKVHATPPGHRYVHEEWMLCHVHAVGVPHCIYSLCCVSVCAYSIYICSCLSISVSLSTQLLFHLSNVHCGTDQSVSPSVCLSVYPAMLVPPTPSLCRRFSDLSLWDIHHTQTPLLSLLQPSVALDIVQSLVDMYKEGGTLPRWPIANGMGPV